MALSLTHPLYWPQMPGHLLSIGFVNFNTFNVAGEGYGAVFYAMEDMVIDRVGWYCSAASGSPTAEVRIESVGTDGLPGGLWATDTNIVTGTLTANTFVTSTLTASATIPKGSLFAVIWKYNSGTSFAVGSTTSGWVASSVPWVVTDTDGDGTFNKTSSGSGWVCAALGRSGGGWYPTEFFLGIGPTSPTNVTWSTSSSPTPTHRGIKFQIPFAARCIGFINGGTANTGDYDGFLYNAAGDTILESRSFLGAQNAGSVSAERHLLWDTPVNLDANTNYRIVIQPTTTTTIGLTNLIFSDAALREASPWDTNWQYTTLNSGTWDDSQTDRIPQMRLILDQIDTGGAAAAADLSGLHSIEQGILQ